MVRPKNAPEILNGWKEIALYLGKGIRTIQRYERNLALPIRRPAGHPSGSVMATKAELDAWVSAPVRESFPISSIPVSSIIKEHTATLEELKRKIAEMHRLQHQTTELREELKATCESLQARFRVVLPGETQLIQFSSQGRTLADVLNFDAKKKVQYSASL